MSENDERLNQPWGWIWTYVSWLVPTRFLPWLHTKATNVCPICLGAGQVRTWNPQLFEEIIEPCECAS